VIKLLKWLLTDGLHAVLRVAIRGHHNYADEARHQFVTKTRSFRGIFAMVTAGKAKQAKRFSFLSKQLTRWRPAVRARTGLPYFSITSRSATAFRCCFATWFASHLFLHIKDRLALVRSRAVASVPPTQRAGGPIERSGVVRNASIELLSIVQAKQPLPNSLLFHSLRRTLQPSEFVAVVELTG